MKGHLLHLSLGPVQEFIAQARRTRDLYQGSELLSELSRHAAVELRKSLGKDNLLIPAVLEDNTENNTGLTNKLYALVPGDQDPSEVAKAVREAVKEKWRGIADEVKNNEKVAPLLAEGIDKVWKEQIDILLEFIAAWSPLDKGFLEARKSVEAAAAARKKLRDFKQLKEQRGGVPKSSLDGGRETVLRERIDDKRYRIAKGEQLDAVGVVKRCRKTPDRYPPIVNVALAPWIEKVHKNKPDLLENLKRGCKEAGVHQVSNEKPCAKLFLYDASVFFPSRWDSIEEEQGIKLDSVKKTVQAIIEKCGEPHPYVVCLVADGDKMGEWKDKCAKADELKDFSEKLSGFADKVKRIVEEEHLGSLVYAGGDDILAFLPLATAADCAKDLNGEFKRQLGDDASLSVGLGIGHLMEAMGDLLELGREAERLAKGAGLKDGKSRNALGIIVDKRSGGRRSWRKQWTDKPLEQILKAQEIFKDNLSAKKVYEIEDVLRRLPDDKDIDNEDENKWVLVLQNEVERSLARAGGETGLDAAKVGLNWNDAQDYAKTRKLVRDWLNRFIIARELHRARGRENCKKGGDAQ